MELAQIKQNLEKKGYRVSVFSSGSEAVAYLDREIDGVSVGIGGSMTIKELGLYEVLEKHNDMAWHAAPRPGEGSAEVMARADRAEVYLSSANAIAASGEIVNIDGNCNRVAATMHGHRRVYFIVGRNKLAPTVEAAIDRARNIAAPKNAKRLGKKTPCVAAGRCMDCSSPERICRALVLFYCAPRGTETEVVLIDEELGY